MPYEVRGGVALHASEIWPFVQDMQRLELAAFGTGLHQFRAELKGCKLLDKDRFRWAAQDSPMSDEERRKHCRGFLRKIAVSCDASKLTSGRPQWDATDPPGSSLRRSSFRRT